MSHRPGCRTAAAAHHEHCRICLMTGARMSGQLHIYMEPLVSTSGSCIHSNATSQCINTLKEITELEASLINRPTAAEDANRFELHLTYILINLCHSW